MADRLLRAQPDSVANHITTRSLTHSLIHVTGDRAYDHLLHCVMRRDKRQQRFLFKGLICHTSIPTITYSCVWPTFLLQAIVSAQEVVKCYRLYVAELVTENDVQDVCRSVVVVPKASFTEFLSCTIEFPADTLHYNEYQPQQLVQSCRHKTLS